MPIDDMKHGGPDVASDQVADVYARAFLGAAEAAGQTDAWVDAYNRLVRETIAPHPDFLQLLGSAFLSREDKKAILDRVFNGRVSDPILVFLKVVADHDRLHLLPAIGRRLRRHYDALRGRVEVSIDSAQPLDSALRSELTATLKRLLGSELELRERTDPRLIGGFVVRVGDKVYDSSIARQLSRIRENMIQRSQEEIDRHRERFMAT